MHIIYRILAGTANRSADSRSAFRVYPSAQRTGVKPQAPELRPKAAATALVGFNARLGGTFNGGQPMVSEHCVQRRQDTHRVPCNGRKTGPPVGVQFAVKDSDAIDVG